MRIVIQARTASNRFPGKALLPINGLPAAALAALRAGNAGGDVVVATSSEASDDALAHFVDALGIRVLRGPAEDVMARYLMAAEDLGDRDVLVRFTGDNVLPDGHFARDLARRLLASTSEIVGVKWPQSRLPYGMFGEAFYVGALRRAAAAAPSGYERQHVTPWLWRNGNGVVLNDLGPNEDLSDRRCTLANFEDYERLQRIFADIPDPVRIEWRALIERLRALTESVVATLARRSVPGARPCEMVLGTAQIGMDYGSVRKMPMPSFADAVELVRIAADLGVRQFDTARAYHHAEHRLGHSLQKLALDQAIVITKLDPLAQVPPDAPGWGVEAAVEASVFASCRALGRANLPVLLLHRASHRGNWNGIAWRRLLELRSQGVIGKLGISVQSPIDAREVIGDPDIEWLQMPFNLFDRRWRESGILAALADRADIVVHVRSVFLQGVLLRGDPSAWPMRPDFAPQIWIERLRELAQRYDRRNVADLCLAYVRSQSWVDGIVIGVENAAQLRENVDLFRAPDLPPAALAAIAAAFADIPAWLLDPAGW